MKKLIVVAALCCLFKSVSALEMEELSRFVQDLSSQFGATFAFSVWQDEDFDLGAFDGSRIPIVLTSTERRDEIIGKGLSVADLEILKRIL